jgi:hypothetical protein
VAPPGPRVPVTAATRDHGEQHEETALDLNKLMEIPDRPYQMIGLLIVGIVLALIFFGALFGLF